MTNEKHFLTSANPVTLLLLLWAWCDYTYFDRLYLGNFSGPLRDFVLEEDHQTGWNVRVLRPSEAPNQYDLECLWDSTLNELLFFMV